MLKTRNELFFKHVILYLYDLKKLPDESHNYITNLNIYEKECIPTAEKVRLWFTQIKDNSLFDEDYNTTSGAEASGEPSTNPEDTQKIPDESQSHDKTLEVQPPSDSHLSFYYEKVIKKLKEEGVDEKEFFEHIISYRYLVCFALLSRHKKKKKKFLDQIVIGGEEWIHYKYLKAQSSKSAECDSSTIKVKVSIWWNNKGVLVYDIFLEEPTSDFYLTELRKLEEALRQQPRVNEKLKVILLHNSFAELETLKSVWLEAQKHKWEILPHPRYSLDIIPSDYHFFGPMNTALQNETRLQNVKELQTWITEWINSKDNEFWEQGIYSLEKRWENVVEEDGWCFGKE